MKNLFRWNFNRAFTLAEVLITLAIIGIVAVLALPPLIKNYNEKAWTTAQSVFEKRLEVATRQMNTEEKLVGYSNTMDFVKELKKYIKITQVCDNSNITKCFDKEVIWNEDDEPVDMSKVKTAASLGQDSWGTDTVAVQFANGVNAVLAYNPNTKQDPYNNQFNAVSASMAILYDVSGNKNPNKKDKDIKYINVPFLAGVTGCAIPEEEIGFCINQILAPESGYNPMTYEECNDALNENLGIPFCDPVYTLDYWSGAVKACGGINNMITMEQLIDLANYLYDTDSIYGSHWIYDLTLNQEKVLPFSSVAPYSGYFWIWSSSGGHTDSRYFSSGATSTSYAGRNGAKGLAVCVDN